METIYCRLPERVPRVTPQIMSTDEARAIATREGVLATEEQAALWTKKVNVKHGHRASTTKSINQIDGAIESNDVR